MNTSYGAVPPSPVVDQVYRLRIGNLRSQGALWWAFLNIVMAIMIVAEVNYSIIYRLLNLSHPSLWYIEICLAMMFILNAFVDVIRYVMPIFAVTGLELSEQQKRLLGVKENEFGLKSPNTTRQMSPASAASPVFTMSTTRPNSSMGAYSPAMSASPYSYSPVPGPSYSPTQSPYNSPMGAGSHGGSFSATPNLSFSNQATGLDSFGLESLSLNDSNSHIRSRFRNMRHSPDEPPMTNMRTLDRFLREQNEKEQKSLIAAEAESSLGSSWAYNRSIMDCSPMMRKYPYQIACRSPQSLSLNDDNTSDTFNSDEVWSRLGVSHDRLDQWVENLRRYLSQTVIVRVSKEIKHLNKELRRLGLDEMEIGEVSLATLKQIAITKGQHLETLNSVIQFLDVSSNQEYLVARIHDLAKGGCLSDFKWNGGMQFRNKPWADHLPTDCAIVMHALCTYLDARLPPHPKYPDGKTFTTKHFLKMPDKPNLLKKDNLIIYQSKINPPHFKVIYGDQIWDIVKGRNNMFQSILLFLYFIKTKDGMLDRVNLGMSGINILWVLEQET